MSASLPPFLRWPWRSGWWKWRWPSASIWIVRSRTSGATSRQPRPSSSTRGWSPLWLSRAAGWVWFLVGGAAAMQNNTGWLIFSDTVGCSGWAGFDSQLKKVLGSNPDVRGRKHPWTRWQGFSWLRMGLWVEATHDGKRDRSAYCKSKESALPYLKEIYAFSCYCWPVC